MELFFLGRGAAFNPKEGNNSAYFVENNQLFLIDCGESIFERLVESGVLESVEAINLMITHTHSDHIGSLGSLAMYSFYTLHKPLNIILPENAKHLPNIEKILSGFGCTEPMYNYVDEKAFDGKNKTFEKIRYFETSHCDELNCYGLLFTTQKGIVYYSGDTREINTIKALLASGQPIDKLYIDTTTANFPSNVHLYIGILQEAIPEELRSRVYCMHLNNDSCIEQAKTLGFNVVETHKEKGISLVKSQNNKER